MVDASVADDDGSGSVVLLEISAAVPATSRVASAIAAIVACNWAIVVLKSSLICL